MPSGQGALGGGLSGAAIGGSFGGPFGAVAGGGIGALLGLFGGGGDKPLSPEAQRLIDYEIQRMQQQDPLFQRLAQMTFDRLPMSAREGIAGPDMGGIGGPSPYADTGDYAQPGKIRELLAAQERRLQMTKPLIDAVTRLANMRLPKKYGPASARRAPDDRPFGGTIPRPIGGGNEGFPSLDDGRIGGFPKLAR